MSVGLYKYKGNIYDDAEEILSENIVSQRMYDTYLEPAIKELKIHYFQDGAKIKKENINSLNLELVMIKKWISNCVTGLDKDYLLKRIDNIQRIIINELITDDDILYIF